MQVWDGNHEQILRNTLVTIATGSKPYLCRKNKMRFYNMHSLLMNSVKASHKWA